MRRRTNLFEALLLVVGLFVILIGYALINSLYLASGKEVSWDMLHAIFLWLILVIFIILLALSEDIREHILARQLKELRSIRELLHSQRKK